MRKAFIKTPIVQPFMKEFKKRKTFSFLPWVKVKYKIIYKEYYRLVENYSFRSEKYRVRLKVEKGFEFDGASAPSIAALFHIRKGGMILAPACVHDKGYSVKGAWLATNVHRFSESDRFISTVTLSRKEQDGIFKEMLLLSGFETSEANLAYAAVRSPAGYLAWNR